MKNFVESISQQFGASLGSNVLSLISAIAILVIGLIVAFVVSKTVGKVLKKTQIDQKLTEWVTGERNSSAVANIENWVETAVFWLLMMFVIIAFLQALSLPGVATPINNLLSTIFSFLPQIGGALVLLGVAWILATIAKTIVIRGLKAFQVDEKINTSGGSAGAAQPLAVSDTVGNALYWFIFLLFIPLILDSLSLQLGPVDTLLNGIADILPNIIGAGFLGLVGWFVAKIVRTIVTNLASALGADQFGERFGLTRATGGRGLSWLAGTVVFISILVPVGISVLNALKIEAVSTPASNMLTDILAAGPRIFTATIILGVSYIIAKIISDLLTSILNSIGFDNIFEWLGIQAGVEADDSDTPTSETGATTLQSSSEGAGIESKTPSEIVGVVALVGILILSLVPATDVLGFAPLTNIVTQLLEILAQVLSGVVIFAVGLYFANLANNVLSSSGGGQARLIGQAARIAIIAFVGALALGQMGIAPSIVNLAFGLLFGAVAIALAVAFGFGGIDIATEQIREWQSDFKSRD
ncbi:MAG: mechanosensitive ion channel [Cyanobacteria bacterium P01_F01_bin.42]